MSLSIGQEYLFLGINISLMKPIDILKENPKVLLLNGI